MRSREITKKRIQPILKMRCFRTSEKIFIKNLFMVILKSSGESVPHIAGIDCKATSLGLNYNDNYYNKKYQGVPVEGYTQLSKIFSLENINKFKCFSTRNDKDYDLVFYTGTLISFLITSMGVCRTELFIGRGKYVRGISKETRSSITQQKTKHSPASMNRFILNPGKKIYPMAALFTSQNSARPLK